MTISTLTKEDFPEGTIVHVKGHGNELFTVDSWDFDEEEGKEFCFADSDYSFGFAFPLEDLELVMTAEAASARTLPDADDIIGGLNILGESWGSGFDINQTDSVGDGTIYAYGETHEGLKFSFALKVTEIEYM